MRVARISVAVGLLVIIGAAEALESASQLAALPGRGRPDLGPAGVALTVVGFALSSAVYAVLGVLAASVRETEGAAARDGLVVGSLAGLLGGAWRALVVRDYLDEAVSRFGLTVDLVTWSLVIFVALAAIASAFGGTMITWLSCRLARSRMQPRPLP